MQFSYSTQSNIFSLSEKIKFISQKNSIYDKTSEIFFEKEKYSLPLLTAHIIQNLTFSDKSKETFLSVIQTYNTENKKDLKFEDFEKIHWIRIIQDEVVLPSAVNSEVWLVSNNKEKNTIDNFFENKRDMILCLAAYTKNHNKPLINKEKLNQILNSLNLAWQSIDFIVEKDILKYDEIKELYYWQRIIHLEQFENEVSALLWVLIKEQFHNPEEAFKRYLYLASKTKLDLQKLNCLLNDNDIKLLCKLAVNYIRNDQDLLICDDELEKMRLDSPTYLDIDVNQKAPNFSLRCNTTYELFEKFKKLENKRNYEFIPQETRNYVYLILQLIIQFEQKQQEKVYINKIMTDLERPYVIFMLRFLLTNTYPQMIPFLISNIELVSLAFQMIDELKLDNSIIISNEEANNKNEKEYKLRNELWFDFFEITLNYFIETYYAYNKNDTENSRLMGEIFSDIFINIVNKIHEQRWSTVPLRYIILNTMQERYTFALTTFKKSRTNFNIYNKGLNVKPKLLYFLLPYMIEHIEFRLSNPKLKYNHFFDFDVTNLSVLTDMIDLAIIPFDSIEIEEKQKQAINDLLPKTVTCIYDYLTHFFTAEKIDVEEYDFSIKKKNVKITSDICKFSEINWDLLIMLMNRYNLFDSLIDIFNSAIKLNKFESRYDDSNQNQYYRIRVMLRILMYSYLNLKKEKSYYNFSIKEQENTVVKLERIIAKYANLYSKDDIPNGHIDAFCDNLVLKEYQYGDTILYLLCSALNYFSVDKQKDFFKEFLADSTNLKRMLTAINIIESEEIKKIIEECIAEINVDNFIDSRLTVTEWEETLVEAINSEKYWHFVEPLIKRIKAHYKKRNYNNEQIVSLLYQVELSLAVRNKNFEELKKIEYQCENIGHHREYNFSDIKKYFMALYFIENDKNYDKAIDLLKVLSSKYEKETRYSLLLYKARFLKCFEPKEIGLTENDREEINIAWQEWQKFEEKIDNEK
jgi:hypothetical protein